MRRSRFTSAAFTLVELMIVLAVVAIIATLAAPSFRDMILSQRLQPRLPFSDWQERSRAKARRLPEAL